MNAAAPTPRFAIGPLGYAIEEKAMRDWIARAKAGDTIAYANGYALPQKAPAVALARTWSDERLVDLTSARVDGKFEYRATRRSDPVGQAASNARAQAVSAAMGGNEATTRVLRRLRSLATQTLPCDTNAELARECELPNADAASYQLRKLAGQGAITVEDMGPGERRIVTIVGSGKRTGRGKL
jgi:hypothetical protein